MLKRELRSKHAGDFVLKLQLELHTMQQTWRLRSIFRSLRNRLSDNKGLHPFMMRIGFACPLLQRSSTGVFAQRRSIGFGASYLENCNYRIT